MQTGFTFKGRHSREFGIYASTKLRPVLPEVKRLTFEPDGADGVVDLSACNSSGRFLYNERVFQINVGVKADDIYKLQNRFSKIASWLHGTGELRFDDLPGIVWDASIISPVEYAPEAAGKKAILSVSINAKPFSRADFIAGEPIPIGSSIPIDAQLPLGYGEDMTATMTSETQTFTVYNIGTAPTRPIITLTGSYTGYAYTVSISDGVTALEFQREKTDTENIVDMENGTLTADGTARAPTGGDFFELRPGENKITISCSLKPTVKISY
ncbi:MAG: phage distal tail protein, partial [Candidatus Ornithomonoglobus sp.]